jgi:XTP/dITP diphosphohydrolase
MQCSSSPVWDRFLVNRYGSSVKTLPPHILIATRNRGKVKEIQDMVKGLPVKFLCLDDMPDAPDVREDRATFEENALKKARTMAATFGIPTLADDSGLCVDALGGRPGVLSARYGGQDASDEQKCLRLLEEMSAVPDDRRTARFVCILALASREGEEKVFSGVCEGRIIHELRGSRGFGYDPIFFYEETSCTFAEMSLDAKNRVSHRGRAFLAFSDYLKSLAL